MADEPLKHYDHEEFCCKDLMDVYFSQPQTFSIEQMLGFPSTLLHALFYSGRLRVDKALDISFGSLVSHLFSLSNACKEIYVIHLIKDSMEHFNQWLESGEKATNWSYAAQRVCHLEGNRQRWKEKEDQTKEAIKGVYEWQNYKTSSLAYLSVPEVDCVLSLWLLPAISKSKEEFQKNLKNFTAKLKLGGHLVLGAAINMTYYYVGKHRYFVLSLKETEVQEMVIKAGFVVEKSELFTSALSTDRIDFSHLSMLLARKIKD
ncbi:indolethylamine N-methyltransferase-like [Gastrophryne carolinensis]